MARSTAYYTLVTSLPHQLPLFANQQLPCSRIQLDRLLTMLNDSDREQLQLLEGLLWWEQRRKWLQPDAQVCADKRRQLQRVSNPLLRGYASWQMELRTLIAALRHRRLAQAPPDSSNHWGIGRWTERIIHNWQAPVFGLEFCFPFAHQLRELLEQDQSLAAEKLLLSELWTRLVRLQDDHYFDFEAVALYVLRWHLIERWVQHQRQAAVDRFDGLVNQVLQQQGLEL